MKSSEIGLDNFYPPIIKQRALGLLQAYQEFMLSRTRYKTYGWHRVRNDIMRDYDGVEARDDRLTAQDLQSYEKTGGQIGNSKFYFIDRFLRTIEGDDDYNELRSKFRRKLVAYYGMALGDFYSASKSARKISFKRSYFIEKNYKDDAIAIVQIDPLPSIDCIPFNVLHVPREKPLEDFDPNHFYQREGRLLEYVLPFSGFLIPTISMGPSERPLSEDIAEAPDFIFIDGTAKARGIMIEHSKRFGHIDFDFTLTATRSANVPDDELSMRFSGIETSPSLWHRDREDQQDLTKALAFLALKRSFIQIKNKKDIIKYDLFFGKYFPETMI